MLVNEECKQKALTLFGSDLWFVAGVCSVKKVLVLVWEREENECELNLCGQMIKLKLFVAASAGLKNI